MRLALRKEMRVQEILMCETTHIWDWMRLPKEMRLQIKRPRTGACRVEEEPTKMSDSEAVE